MALGFEEVRALKKLLRQANQDLGHKSRALVNAKDDIRSTPLYIEHCEKRYDRCVREVERLEAILRTSWEVEPGE